MSDSAFRPRVVLAGQVPPPVGGQNINIARILEILRAQPGLQADHWEFSFTPQWKEGRQRSWRKLVELFKVLGRLLKLRLRGPIDLLIYPSGGPHFAPVIRDIVLLPPACWLSRKVVVHFHAAGVAKVLPGFAGWVRGLLRAAHAGCFGAVSLTEFGRRDPEALDMRRIEVMPLAIEDEPPPPAPEAPPREVPVLLNVGHLCPDKGTPQLLEAARQALDAGVPDFRLRLVGECLPPYGEERLAGDIRRLGLEQVVECAGLKRGGELERAYADGDLFIFSSLAPYESFGMVLIEAMRFHLPLLVTDWRANAEVAGAGQAFGGVLVPSSPDLPARLAEGLRSCLEQKDRWRDWGRRNRACFEQHYRLDVLERNLTQFIQKNTGHRAPTPS
ncbi:MAG: glycosyltransferase family 4 protein [Verrucomicrobiota bacterium]